MRERRSSSDQRPSDRVFAAAVCWARTVSNPAVGDCARVVAAGSVVVKGHGLVDSEHLEPVRAGGEPDPGGKGEPARGRAHGDVLQPGACAVDLAWVAETDHVAGRPGIVGEHGGAEVVDVDAVSVAVDVDRGE